MSVNPSAGNARKSSATWRRRVGVFACLLGLLSAVFGHIERPAAGIAASDLAVISTSHSDASSQDDGALVTQHCAQNAQCSAQAVLQTAPAIDPHGSNAVRPAAEQLGGDQVISPLRHPPKTLERL
jgi:hypothetical protein